MARSQEIKIEGTVATGYESVRRLYEKNMKTLKERDTQLCIYVKGEKVVDLWATVDNPQFTPDSLVNVFSSGKSLESIAMASLCGKGLLDFNAKITDYWPEFGASGKGEVTVAELMRHEAGLAAFNTPIAKDDLLTENIKKNKIGKIIEGHPQKFRDTKGRIREYHAMTRGWIVNELFRRIDPEGRTIGEYLRQDISEPLGIEAIIGAKEEELDRIVKVKLVGAGFQVLESLKPKMLKRKMEYNLFQLLGGIVRAAFLMKGGTSMGAPPPIKGSRGIGDLNDPAIVKGEIPSANAQSSARSLAKIAAVISSGGKGAGLEIINEAGWNALHENPVEADMGFTDVGFTQAGVASFIEATNNSSKLAKATSEGREGFYGWFGLGGSIFQWHPECEIGFGYVPTSLHLLDFVNERGKAYQTEVLKCVQRINNQ
ncbi:MAG: beta-lactamase family protein [Pseudomonadales bacterium]|nr:beta-lactamase family protein [Pseudomonadales bacterium]